MELRDHGIRKNRFGRYGGYRLARIPEKIAASAIIRIADGPLALAPCASKMHFGACADCPDIETCPLCPMLRKARDAIADVLDGYSLALLATGQRADIAGRAKRMPPQSPVSRKPSVQRSSLRSRSSIL
ncbi:MAG TPA: Rrf2 family transcriptional regulator [Acetobacteraceae bacterium]|nr:Rrf2 family transcriptional regulator [Acetobacteraceae bacterium]